jgi:hypothetical protein
MSDRPSYNQPAPIPVRNNSNCGLEPIGIS